MYIGEINHPQHWKYYIFFSDGKFGIGRDKSGAFCAYSSISEALKSKSL